MNKEKNANSFNRLVEVMETLRAKCPWDSTQTWDSLRPNSLEEMYELLDAIGRRDTNEIKKELGDVMLHVIFYSQLATEEGKFDVADICDAESDKLIFRHPFIYGNQDGVEDEDTWEQRKQKEKDGNKTVLGGVPANLPSLIKAYRIQDKARNVGYKVPTKSEQEQQISEDLNQIKNIDRLSDEQKEDLFGDLLFRMVNLTRLYGVNPETALEKQNRQFIKNFNEVEQKAKQANKSIKEM